jgi:preprotein translocase subunit SecG
MKEERGGAMTRMLLVLGVVWFLLALSFVLGLAAAAAKSFSAPEAAEGLEVVAENKPQKRKLGLRVLRPSQASRSIT